MGHVEDLRDAILHDCEIAIHLHGKLPPGSADYRPSPAQRSTTELLRYLAGCGIGSALAMRDGSWKGYEDAMDRVAEMPAAGFPDAMRRQKEEIRELLAGLTDADLATRTATLPWGEVVSLGRGLTETTLKWLTAYRMQLFLYAKASGATEIGTANNWAGVDHRPR